RVHNSRVELGTAAAFDLCNSSVMRHRITIGAHRSHCVISVCDCKDSCCEWYLVTSQLGRIPCSIKHFLVVQDDWQRVLEKRDIREHPIAKRRMLIHQFALELCQWSGF